MGYLDGFKVTFMKLFEERVTTVSYTHLTLPTKA